MSMLTAPQLNGIAPTYLAETHDFMWVPVWLADLTDDDPQYELVTSGVEYSVELAPVGGITPRPGAGATAPGQWQPAVVFQGRTGVNIENYTSGTWAVYARIADTPYEPVIPCGTFTVN